MAFCYKCGSRISDDNKFCPECGATNLGREAEANAAAVNQASADVNEPAPATERVQEFSGKISKCPNCGQVLKALSAKCPACGMELQGVRSASSVEEFSDKIAKTVSTRQKIDLIRNYPIPNAKQDIFEFLVLATSNFDTKKYLDSYGADKQVYEAWLSKIEQSYVKAETLFKTDKDFGKFQELYDSDVRELQAARANQAGAKHYVFGTILMLMAGMVFTIMMVKGTGIPANIRLFITALVFFANGIISYIYASRKHLKLIAFIAYCVDAVLNLGFCFVAPGHFVHVIVIVACGLGAFIDKKKLSKEE